MSVRHLHRVAVKLTQELCREEFAPCTMKVRGGASCMARAQDFKDKDGKSIPFEHYDRHMRLCKSCMSYWLSLRLAASLSIMN